MNPDLFAPIPPGIDNLAGVIAHIIDTQPPWLRDDALDAAHRHAIETTITAETMNDGTDGVVVEVGYHTRAGTHRVLARLDGWRFGYTLNPDGTLTTVPNTEPDR